MYQTYFYERFYRWLWDQQCHTITFVSRNTQHKDVLEKQWKFHNVEAFARLLTCAHFQIIFVCWVRILFLWIKLWKKSSFLDMLYIFHFWWLVRVTLVVGLVFLPQNFGLVVGTYEGCSLFCKCRWGGDSTWRWWGHLNTTCSNWTCLNFLLWEVVGRQKPSLCCLCSPSLPFAPFTLLCSLHYLPR